VSACKLSVTVVTDRHGVATSPPLRANARRGKFTITAAVAGIEEVLILDLAID
jgi:hypothetical protein